MGRRFESIFGHFACPFAECTIKTMLKYFALESHLRWKEKTHPLNFEFFENDSVVNRLNHPSYWIRCVHWQFGWFIWNEACFVMCRFPLEKIFREVDSISESLSIQIAEHQCQIEWVVNSLIFFIMNYVLTVNN